MRIAVDFDTSRLKVRTERETKRLAFNTALALNETIKQVQLDERVNLDRKFTLRKTGFIYRLIKIFSFANARQGRPFAEIGVDATKKRVHLARFEKGGERPPVKGKSVAVPVTGGPARARFPQSVAAAFRFSALRLRPGPGRIVRAIPFLGAIVQPQRTGEQDTFQTARGVFQRIQEKVRAVYLFIRRPKLDRRLDFVDVARRTIAREWREQFRKAYRR